MIISDKIYINTKELGPLISSLCLLFTYNNPEYYEKKRLKLSVNNIDPKLFHYKIDFVNGQQCLILPRGSIGKVRKFYEENNLIFTFKDERILGKKIDVCLNTDTKLESNQNKIIDILVKNEGGLIQAITGIGKSISILGLIAKLKQPTLIIIDEFRLSDQWIGEIKKRLSGNFKLGIINSDSKKEENRDGDIVVGIIDSLVIKYRNDPDYFKKFGMVILDESQVSSSESYTSLVNNIAAKYRVGVTATVKRKDGMHILSLDMLGPILLDIDSNEAKNRVTNFTFKIINTNLRMQLASIYRWTGKKRELTLDAAKSLSVLTDNQERNNIIVNEVSKAIESGLYPLVLSDRIEHNEKLAEHLQNLGYKVVLLIGKTRKKANWEEIRQDTSIQCIVANTSIASKGLDLPRLSALFLTCPSSNLPQLKQRIGRIRRFVEGKPLPTVYDFVDNLAYLTNELLQKIYIFQMTGQKRLRYYKQLQQEYDKEI